MFLVEEFKKECELAGLEITEVDVVDRDRVFIDFNHPSVKYVKIYLNTKEEDPYYAYLSNHDKKTLLFTNYKEVVAKINSIKVA